MKQIEVTVRTVEFTTFLVEVDDKFDPQTATRMEVEELFDHGDWPEKAAETSSWGVDEVFDESRPLGERRVQF